MKLLIPIIALLSIFELGCSKEKPKIDWDIPSSFPKGFKLSTFELNANADVPGEILYSPPLGTLVDKDVFPIQLTFIPEDLNKYDTIRMTKLLHVISFADFLKEHPWKYNWSMTMNSIPNFDSCYFNQRIFFVSDSGIRVKQSLQNCYGPKDTIYNNYWQLSYNNSLYWYYGAVRCDIIELNQKYLKMAGKIKEDDFIFHLERVYDN